MSDLTGKKVAIIVNDNFEQAELTFPKEMLEKAGATTHIIAPRLGHVQGLHHIDKGNMFVVDRSLDEANVNDYDGVVLPGGTINADQLRMNEKAREFVGKAYDDGKPLAVICHAPWMLVSTGIASGKKLTSYPTLQDDLRNAGAEWVDEEVVVDENLITSRNPDDLPAFSDAMIAALAG